MKYKILRGILIAGVVVGFGSGFAHLGARWAMHRDGHHPHWSKHCRDRDRDHATPDATSTARSAPTAAKPAPTLAPTPAPPAPTAL